MNIQLKMNHVIPNIKIPRTLVQPPLISAMRAYVVQVMGRVIEVPVRLVAA